MIPSLLFLAVRMKPGFGVTVVIDELCKCLSNGGINVAVGCQEAEGEFTYPVRLVDPDPEAVLELANSFDCRAVVAQTSPYFEVLPHLPRELLRVAWEHGDPTPAFFPHDQAERQHVVDNKLINVYPAIDGVIASSEFLRNDIRWPSATIIQLAADHMPDLGAKVAAGNREKPLRIGTLMRLGKGESYYKGNQLYLELVRELRNRGVATQFEVMGRGSAEDVEAFQAEGVLAHLNSSETDKVTFLRDLDVLISCSQWEGFNLPLVEAQALGTAAMAFDVGAHPEVTPLVVSNRDDAVSLVEAYSGNRDLLLLHSNACYRYVRKRFSWQRAASELMKVLGDA